VTSHAQARALARTAVERVFHREALGGEAAGLAGVAWLETNYGAGWKGAGKFSRNLGAIQCGAGWLGKRFSYVDTHPNADGTSTQYKVDFRAYDTDADAWFDLCKVVFVNRGRVIVRAAAMDRDWHAMSAALHSTGYYEGYGKTVADRINNHHRALSGAIALADGVPAPVTTPPAIAVPRTLRYGATGEDVKVLQGALGLAKDGIFGMHTGNALQMFQRTNGLLPDRVCGPATWAKIFAVAS
jgi:hypothetical protein